MKDFFRNGLTVLLFSSLIFLCACDSGDDDDDDGSPTISLKNPDGTSRTVPRINGKWSGSFFRTSEVGSTPVKATIQQSGDAVTITTDLDPTIGARFTGNIQSSGKITLTDAEDGEVWTTHFGPATTNFVKIADFIEAPSALEPDKPLKVIELRR